MSIVVLSGVSASGTTNCSNSRAPKSISTFNKNFWVISVALAVIGSIHAKGVLGRLGEKFVR
jgi:hypothetical protein